MEGTPLRSVPVRPLHPVEPADAIAHVAERLPDLGARERDALALVDLAGRSRVDAARELALEPAILAEALASGRKALRRTLEPLPAGGWCERAERLISDRLDGALAAPGAPASTPICAAASAARRTSGGCSRRAICCCRTCLRTARGRQRPPAGPSSAWSTPGPPPPAATRSAGARSRLWRLCS